MCIVGIVIALSPVKGSFNFEKGGNNDEHGRYSMGADLFSIGSAHDNAGVGLLLRRSGTKEKCSVYFDAVFHHFSADQSAMDVVRLLIDLRPRYKGNHREP
jgi:hypothetical protein